MSLVSAEDPDLMAVPAQSRRAGDDTVRRRHVGPRGAALVGDPANDRAGGALRIDSGDQRHAWADRARLLGRHEFHGVAEDLGVLQRDLGDHVGRGGDGGGRVEAPAQADLEDHRLGPRLGELEARDGEHRLEEGRLARHVSRSP